MGAALWDSRSRGHTRRVCRGPSHVSLTVARAGDSVCVDAGEQPARRTSLGAAVKRPDGPGGSLRAARSPRRKRGCFS